MVPLQTTLAGAHCHVPRLMITGLLMLATLVSCAEATPTPTPQPTPFVEISGTPDPTLNAKRLNELSRLLSLVPAGYAYVGFLDIRVIEEIPTLRGEFGLENLGLAGVLTAVAGTSLETVLLADRVSQPGPIIVLSGPIDMDRLSNMMSSQGIAMAAEPEAHRGYQIRSGNAPGLATLSIAAVGNSTAVVSLGPPGQDRATLDLTKSALDAFDGLTPRLPDDPKVASLLSSLPMGFAIVVHRDCPDFPDLAGCTAWSLGGDTVSGNTMIVATLLVGFETEAQASAALPKVQEIFGPSGSVDVAVRQEGTMIQARLIAPPGLVGQAFEAFNWTLRQ